MKKIPKHLALIPDGNRRWARKNNKSDEQGHNQGYRNFLDFCKWCQSAEIKTLTAYAFSTENWKRAEREVKELMVLFKKAIEEFSGSNQLENTKIKVVGERDALPSDLQESVEKIEAETKGYRKLQLNLALSYGGRWEITEVVKKLAKKAAQEGEKFAKKIDQKAIEANLLVKDSPDLIIRTGGENRLSNFLTWQSAYSELYFSDKLWPDFNKGDFDSALADYAERKRRFGK